MKTWIDFEQGITQCPCGCGSNLSLATAVAGSVIDGYQFVGYCDDDEADCRCKCLWWDNGYGTIKYDRPKEKGWQKVRANFIVWESTNLRN